MAKSDEADYDLDTGPAPFDHAAFAPPWQALLPDGTLGPEYGPQSYVTEAPISMDRAVAEWRESRDGVESGGLWDHEREPVLRTRAQRAIADRYDKKAVLAFIDRNSGTMAKRLLEVSILYWEHRVSGGQIALKLGVKKDRIWETIKEMRRLVHPRGQSGVRLAHGSSLPADPEAE